MLKYFFIYFFGLLLSISFGYGQNHVKVREQFRFRDTISIDKYEIQQIGFKAKKLNVDVANYRIVNTKDIEFLQQQTIVRVDLVYTDFPRDENHIELNRKRLLEFNIHFPETMSSSVIEWNIVKQTGPMNAGSVRNYFHGFVVYYREMPTKLEEKRLILDMIEKNQMTDSSVYKVLDRNRAWKNTLVVCDVTGSMAPYTLQILLWLKANAKLNTFDQVVFFNDDEENSTNQTVKLDTSGIWDIESKNGQKVVDVAVDAMMKGNHIENNLEAVCYAINKYPKNLNNVVMIADNWENPCDMQLLSFLKSKGVKIHIIICGVTDRLNTIYLDIAYATGGTVHTMEEDLAMVSNLGDGRTFNLGDMKFKMVGGSFLQVK